MKTEIPKEIENVLNYGAKMYADSPATTNAGRVLRFLARFIKAETIIKLFAHKLK